MPVSPEEYAKRLDAISEHEGVPYGRAYLLFEEEDKHAQATLKYKGHLALSDAFKCFFLETVELTDLELRPKVKDPLSEFYALFVPRLAHSFQSICGAERVAIRGYPYHAYTLLRNVFDIVLLLSGGMQKMADLYSIEGIEPGKPLDPKAMRKLRKSTEFEVRRKMVGDQSALTPKTIDELSAWDELFDYETHGARLSLTQSMAWMKKAGPLPVLPSFDESAYALFMNRHSEVGWMIRTSLHTRGLKRNTSACMGLSTTSPAEVLTPNPSYMDSPQKDRGGPIGSDGEGEPAVVYPAS